MPFCINTLFLKFWWLDLKMALRLSELHRVKCYPTLSESLTVVTVGVTDNMAGRVGGSPYIALRLGSVYTCLSQMIVAKFSLLYYYHACE
jgi:hypothetical protein